MRLQIVQDALKKKNIKYEYTETDGCGSLDFLFRGLKFHVWEYEDRVWGAETNIYEAGRSQDIEGDYENIIVSRKDRSNTRKLSPKTNHTVITARQI